ncbi:MAG: NUDIX hydrolase [Porticoccaceae bacterium]|jgi:8-oxo-dGTP pyrophosphatase MutT (NUDIX family)|nr:NUDIX hydrolase [Porticoccaceae bacterium]
MAENDLRLAATAVLLRDTEQGLQTLLLRRNAKLAFAGGAWVFPGGAIDQSELLHADNELQAAAIAAVREVEEECGLLLNAGNLVHFCNWTTPEGESRRFATWFFVAQAQHRSADIVIDDGEIHEFQWITPQKALDLHGLGELNMMPPTVLSMRLIRHYQTAAEVCEKLAVRDPYEVTPRICQLKGQVLCLYPGDSGYESLDPEIDGPKHRTLFSAVGTKYIHSGDDVKVTPMDRP